MNPHRPKMKIMHPPNAGHNPCEGSRNFRGGCIRYVYFPIHIVAVYFRTERVPYLCGGATEGDPVPSTRDIGYREALCFEPGRNFLDVCGAHSKTIGPLLRGDPLVVVRRLKVLLFNQEFLKRFLLPRRWRHLQSKGTEAKRRVGGPLIVL